MFGGFGNFGAPGGQDPNQQPQGFGVNMQMNMATPQMTVTETTTTSNTAMGMSGGMGGSGPNSDDMNKRFQYRTQKLVEYKGLIDFLQIKGHDVNEMLRAHFEA